MGQLILIGFMGAGKTVVGQELARLKDSAFIDLDTKITEVYGPISTIFSAQGETKFRQLEYEQLTAPMPENSVIATGGGIVTYNLSREWLMAAPMAIWLKVSFKTVQERLHAVEQAKRPLFDDQVKERFDRRQDLYESCAKITLDVDTMSVTDIAETIINRYG